MNLKNKKALLLVATPVLLLFSLFDVSFNPEFALPQESDRPNAEQELRYQACYEELDAEIHRTAFGTIDNPDVQKEFITNNRARATAECRSKYPRMTESISTPLRFNVIYLGPRFW